MNKKLTLAAMILSFITNYDYACIAMTKNDDTKELESHHILNTPSLSPIAEDVENKPKGMNLSVQESQGIIPDLKKTGKANSAPTLTGKASSPHSSVTFNLPSQEVKNPGRLSQSRQEENSDTGTRAVSNSIAATSIQKNIDDYIRTKEEIKKYISGMYTDKDESSKIVQEYRQHYNNAEEAKLHNANWLRASQYLKYGTGTFSTLAVIISGIEASSPACNSKGISWGSASSAISSGISSLCFFGELICKERLETYKKHDEDFEKFIDAETERVINELLEHSVAKVKGQSDFRRMKETTRDILNKRLKEKL